MKLSELVSFSVLFAAGLAASGALAGEFLVSRSSLLVSRYEVGADGRWKFKGHLVDGTSSAYRPSSIASAHDGSILVGDGGSGGRILRFSPDGKELGVFAATGFTPLYLTLDPDLRHVYCTDGKNVFRYALSTGKGGRMTDGGMRQPQGMAFGGDGRLYVACTDEGAVAVFDVDGEKAVPLGKIECFNVTAAITFAGKSGSVLVLPSERTEMIDLVSGKSVLSPAAATLRDLGCAGWMGDRLVAFDYPSGDVYSLSLADGKVEKTGEGIRYVNGLVDMSLLDSSPPRFRRPAGKLRHEIKSSRNDFSRLACNNPSSTVFLKGGFGTDNLHVTDWNGDGRLDIITTSGWDDWVWRGNYLFINPPEAGQDPDPVFPKSVKIPDGEYRSRFPYLGWRTFYGTDGKPLRAAHYTKTCYERRQLIDWDGDGRDDLVITVSDREWDEWHDKYDDRGIWTAGRQLHAYVYVARCVSGSGAGARYAEPQIVRLENGHPLEVYGNPPTLVSDWDGDGDLDMILFDFMDNITFFENIGTRREPVYTSGRLMHDADGRRLCGELCLPTATTADWDGDGKLDIFIGEEDARVGWFRNTGRLHEGMPVFERVRYFRQQADELNFGVLNTPAAYDWDGDGDQDIISGNSHGQIAFIENLSGPGTEKPKWAAPVYLREPDGKIVWITAGPNGSIQGPCESEWGYTVVSVADWDGDGKPDIMANTVRGEIRWWRNIGTRRSPKLGFAEGVEVEWNGPQPRLKWGWIRPETQKNPKWIVAPWRTTPVMHDFNGDGLVDLMLMDGENNLAFYERARTSDGRLVLKHPRKAFLDEGGKPLWFPGSWGTVAGGSGRYKFTVCDWDGDGRDDIIFNGGPNAYLLRQVGSENGSWRYRYAGPLARLKLSTHNPAPAACDFNGDGKPDMLMGPMDGYFYYLKNDGLK